MKSPWDIFEERTAEALGAELVPNSGQGKWAKLDVRGATLLVSCKWTDKATRAYRPAEMDEAVRAVRGQGGVGGDVLPALAIGIQDDEPIIAMKASDFAELVLNRVPPDVPMRPSEARRAAARDTPLMRRIMEDMD